MAHLSVRLLGGFQVMLDDLPVDGFRTQKARALLAYLAAESDRPHTRSHLAGLLWPDTPESGARAYLRNALANLRTLLGDQDSETPFLVADQQTLRLNPQADHWVDVVVLRTGLAAIIPPSGATSEEVLALSQALGLYRGRFLEGFFLKECSEFDEWQLLTSEAVQREVVEAHSLLANQHESIGDHASALHHAWRCAELEPLSDEANRTVIRLLAARHDSAAALAHYNRFRDLLADELATTPAPETIQLAAQIAARPATHVPASLTEPIFPLPPFLPDVRREMPSTPLVARAAQLATLHEHLEAAIQGEGRILFVVGDAGQGKTALVREFANQAVLRHDCLLAIRGTCSNFRGVGDPYLPFREILVQLCGDFLSQWEANDIPRELARRLWRNAPNTLDILLSQGADLIDTILPATVLLERATAMQGSEERKRQVESQLGLRRRERMAGAQQHALFDQCTRVLHAIAREQPLLLMIDDLHWGDLGSLALLFHMGQRLGGCRILAVGAFRPEEVALGWQGARHPLERLVPEFQQQYGQIVIDLNDADGRAFVDAYVDLEPNRLGKDFRDTLYGVSGGHPLYTVELMQEMRTRGALVQGESGCWRQHSALDWHLLPARVEATIGRRIERLPPELRSVLDAAAVQGGEFCADVAAAVIDETVVDTMRMLKELQQRYRLVTPHGSHRVGDRRLVDFRFDHILFREYVIDRLDEAAYLSLNEAVAKTLEALYADHPDARSTMAGRLAWHFQEADLPGQAAPYCVEAGDGALRLYAYDEGLAHFQKGLSLLKFLPDEEQRLQLELKMLIGVGATKSLMDGAAASGLARIWNRARLLSEQVGNLHQRFQILRYQWELRFERGELQIALTLADACLRIAEEADIYRLESHAALGPTLYRLGEMVRAGEQFDHALALCTGRPETHISHLHTENPMVNALSNGALVRWYLGYPDQARRQTDAGIAAAEAIDHPFSRAYALTFATALHQRAAMPAETERYARQTMGLSEECGFALWSAVANLYCGWARVAQGELASGLQQTRAGLDAIRATGMEHIRFAAVLADVYLRCGRINAGLSLIAELLATVARTGEREWEAELHRLQGECLICQNAATELIESSFERAVAVAVEQGSRCLELRALVSLTRFLTVHGRDGKARQRLAAAFDWFTEGFDTPDLQAAAEILVDIDEESCAHPRIGSDISLSPDQAATSS